MNCPACGNNLTEKTVSELTVDVCENGCGGVWFDNYELPQVDESSEALGEALLDIPRNADARVNPEQRPCPKCAGITMLRHSFGVKQEVEIDECGSCGGIWLDANELASIRTQFASKEEQAEIEGKFFAQFDAELAAMKTKSAEDAAKAQGFARALRFICPSYYIKGDQAGGAF